MSTLVREARTARAELWRTSTIAPNAPIYALDPCLQSRELRPWFEHLATTVTSEDMDVWLDDHPAGVFVMPSCSFAELRRWMTDDEQAQWINDAARRLPYNPGQLFAWQVDGQGFAWQAVPLAPGGKFLLPLTWTDSATQDEISDFFYNARGLAHGSIMFGESPLGDLHVTARHGTKTPTDSVGADVSVIRLRAHRRIVDNPENMGELVDWSCQWFVRAHERRLRSGRTVHVRGHVKGPADKPFRPRVYRIDR